jgi:hypothetical protein
MDTVISAHLREAADPKQLPPNAWTQRGLIVAPPRTGKGLAALI